MIDRRPGITAQMMQGQMFDADQALENGLIDDIVENKQEVIDFLIGENS